MYPRIENYELPKRYSPLSCSFVTLVTLDYIPYLQISFTYVLHLFIFSCFQEKNNKNAKSAENSETVESSSQQQHSATVAAAVSKDEGSQQESSVQESVGGGDLAECDMTASMLAKRITTEGEAKAALAERRRLAREQAERDAEIERQRLVIMWMCLCNVRFFFFFLNTSVAINLFEFRLILTRVLLAAVGSRTIGRRGAIAVRRGRTTPARRRTAAAVGRGSKTRSVAIAVGHRRDAKTRRRGKKTKRRRAQVEVGKRRSGPQGERRSRKVSANLLRRDKIFDDGRAGRAAVNIENIFLFQAKARNGN